MAAMLRRMGRWNEAVAVGLEGLAVDPRNANLHTVVGRALLRMRRFDQAERYTRQAMELSPGVPVFFGDLVRIALWGRGDTATARTWVADGKDQTTVVQNRFTAMEAELAWWRRRPEALELFRDAGSSDLVALIHRREGRPEEARGIGETILQDATRRLVVLETHQVQPAVQRVRVDRAFAMTLLDRRDDALSELERALDPGWLDSFSSPAVEAALAYTELGRPEEAIDILARLLAEPSELTVARLRLDPRWDPLRDESAFQALVEGRPPSGG